MQLDRETAVVEELRALNQQKDDFVSSVTHELRTPITTITGFSDELEQTPLDDEQKAYVAIIQRNAMRLQSVVEDVLTFSRRMPEAAAPGLVDVDFAAVIGATLDDLRHSICDKRIAVTNSLPDESLMVIANANDLTRVVINLLTNAVKFSPLDGTLDLTAAVADGDLTITIVDSGPGIAPKDIEKVFDPFYRASRSAHDGVPGTGLGLSIVRDLVTHMNGQIVLESDGVKGTTARVTLPLSATVTAVV
jgi:signal transduction histidine kinase